MSGRPVIAEKPWRSFGPPRPGVPAVALATQLHLARWSAMPAFVRHTYGSTRQLSRTPGVLGYSLRAAPHRRTFWTLTLWEDRAAMAAYVRAEPHRTAMRWLTEDLGSFVSTDWTVAGDAGAPTWEDGLSRLGSA